MFLISSPARGLSFRTDVSWIVAPYTYCEHPDATSSAGEAFSKRLLETIMAEKDIWEKCVIFLTYDENDGYFDHVPAPIPPLNDSYESHNLTSANGISISFFDETYEQEPIGLGPRVPMLVISPWSKGGRVSSRLSDHTSVIRFIETWGYDANSVKCTNISEWRRAVCGNLTEMIGLNTDFSVTNFEKSSAGCNGPHSVLAPYPYSDKDKFAPAIAAQDRKACPLPYNYEVVATRNGTSITITFDNSKSSAASTFIVYIDAQTSSQKAFHYTVAAHSEHSVSLTLTDTAGLCEV
ncbi:alkaline phosphatase family protein [Serratia liquefaciens]|uniref:Uncharacterized protein n=1 Tax=Serratia liquefaciens TaxID=614 RepID=A0A515D5K0_SERLI|nr:alkaline phosphatase family protein [Serratia liquefaciens]QDL35681.1 hypothetical protein EGO53_28190 [Serratia liquefaciens]